MSISHVDFHLWGILLIVSLGLVFGAAECRVNGMCPMRSMFWKGAAAVVFFVPLALLWSLQGQVLWSVILMVGFLWGVYLCARVAGATIYERFIDGRSN